MSKLLKSTLEWVKVEKATTKKEYTHIFKKLNTAAVNSLFWLVFLEKVNLNNFDYIKSPFKS